VMLRAMSRSSAAEQRLLTTILGNPAASADDMAAVREIVVRTGSDTYARECSERYLAEALQILEATLQPSSERELLRSWILAMVRRKR